MSANDKRGERAALYAGFGAAAGTLFGVVVGMIFSGLASILVIAILGVLGAVFGMFVGYGARGAS